MQYSQIIWATLYGYLFFDETVKPNVIVGAGIMILSGLYIVFREGRGKTSENTPGAVLDGHGARQGHPAECRGLGPAQVGSGGALISPQAAPASTVLRLVAAGCACVDRFASCRRRLRLRRPGRGGAAPSRSPGIFLNRGS